MTTRYFVWVSGLKGPEAQIWDEKTKMANMKPIKTLIVPISIESDMSLDKLKLLYPFEAKP